jgi:hypothetical protein
MAPSAEAAIKMGEEFAGGKSRQEQRNNSRQIPTDREKEEAQ